MVHIWLREETRPDEKRCALTPEGAKALLDKGFKVTVEDAADRVIAAQDFKDMGCEIAPAGSWVDAPSDVIILGLKELPDDGTDLRHSHIMFGHAYKGQFSGQRLLERFKRGGGTLYDLEYLTEANGRRVAAFGYWAGYAGAAVTLKAWAAQRQGGVCPAVTSYENKDAMLSDIRADVARAGSAPNAIVIGALGRVGSGVVDLCTACGVDTTKWDMAETSKGGPFPEILQHDLFFNCVLAGENTPVFVPADTGGKDRKLTAIGDIACDPDSDYNPVPLYSEATSWAEPVIRAHDAPPLDVMAIDNLPSLLPLESSLDFAEQLLPHLHSLDALDQGVWGRAEAHFTTHTQALEKVSS